MIEAVLAKSAELVDTLKKTASESRIKDQVTESKIGESKGESSLSSIENKSLESLKVQNQLETRNCDLLNQKHPETGIPFKQRIIECSNGEVKTGVFPDFKEYRLFQVKLPENMLRATDKDQFNLCNEKLKAAFDKGTVNVENFSSRQLEQIKNGDKPEGLTWHHNEKKGRMELVDTKVHQLTGHTGGREVWGGGAVAR